MDTSEIARAYDAIVEAYAEVRSLTVGLSYVDILCDRLPEGARILDVGCGTGIPLTGRLVDRGFQVHGIDISSRMIERARRNVARADFEVADVLSWTPGGSFEGVLAWDSLFHLQPRMHLPVIKKFYAALEPGGVILFTVGGKQGEIRSSMLGHEFYYSSLSGEAYAEALQAIGFEVVVLEMDQPGEDHVVIMADKKERPRFRGRG